MFYNLIKRNSKSGRKENSLYFVSLVVAFYVILSIENQDVMKFIKSMESDAVQKLLLLIPIFYVFSLFVLSFLVFFTTRYRLERRSHELGLYLMMGMKRSRLFFMLIAEDMVNTAVAFLAGYSAYRDYQSYCIKNNWTGNFRTPFYCCVDGCFVDGDRNCSD